jgi:hypothetical protein
MGELLVEPGERKTPQITDNEQGVFVDRVCMKEVVLHAPDNATERRNVKAQDPVKVHAPEFVCNARRFAQDGKEQAVIAGILSELVVNQV